MGSTWHYRNIESFAGPGEGYLKITTIGDTLIQGRSCRILEKLEYRSNGMVEHEGFQYLSVEGDTVWRFAADNQFYMLYNFSANVGDSWTSRTFDDTFGEDVEYTISVDSLATINVNGFNLRMLYCSTDNPSLSWNTGEVVEVLGGLAYMFPFNYAFLDFDVRLGLRCYGDSLFGDYNSGISSECDGLVTNVVEYVMDGPVSFYPNPSSGEVTFEVTKESDLLNIYSIDGKPIETLLFAGSKRVVHTFNKKGIYLVELVSGEARSTRKLVIH